MSITAVPLKHPLVDGKPIRARLAQQTLHSVIYGVLIALIPAGLYYGITQVNWYVHLGPVYFHIFYLKHWWDHTLGTWLSQHVWFITQANWPDYRHAVTRNLAEPAIGILAVMSLLAPAKYWKDKVGPARIVGTLAAFPVVYVVLATGGTWLILHGQAHWNPSGISRGLWTVAQFGILGFIIGWVLKHLFGLVGARAQGGWIERAADNRFRHERGGLPLWVRLPLVAPTIRERYSEIYTADVASGEAQRLMYAGASHRSRALYWLGAAGLVLLLGIAFLGFVGHIWVGVLGHSFPYLAS